MKIVTLKHKFHNEKITYWDVEEITLHGTLMSLKIKNSNTVILKNLSKYNIEIEEV